MIEGILHFLAGCFLLSAAGVDICSDDNLILRCDSDSEVLLIGDSYYGRLHRNSRCLKDDLGPIGCAVNVTPLLSPLCSGRRSCNVTNVKDVLAKSSACRTSLQSYLELDYKCVRATISSIPCAEGTNDHVIVHTPTTTSGRLTSLDSPCAWLIQSAPGLRINLTLEDVLPQEPCLDIARVTEGSEGGDGVVLRSCGVGNRERSSVLHYASKGNEVKVEMVAQGERVYERFFVIDYKIYGCAYPSIPRDAVVVDRRWSDGTGAIWIQCRNHETSRTILVCTRNGVWTGNASLTCPTANEIDLGTDSETWLPIGLTLLITMGIALLVCFVILGSGMCYLYRRKRHNRTDVLLHPIRPNPTRSAHPLATPPIYDTPQLLKFHTLPLAQLHHHYASTLPHSQRPVCPVRPTGFGGRPPMPVPVPRVPELTPSQMQCTCTHENPPRGRGQMLNSDQSAFSGRSRGVGTGQSDYAPLTNFSTFKPELESPYEDPNESLCNVEPLTNKQ